MLGRRLFPALALILAGSLAACATGRSPAGSGAWLVLTQSDTTSTSRCIGRPDSPLCAVETLLACFQRGRQDLCRMVDDNSDQYAQAFATPADPGKYLAYRIVRLGQVTADQTLPPVMASKAPRPGDVLVTLEQREETTGRRPAGADGVLSHFLTRRQAGGTWAVTGWGDPGE